MDIQDKQILILKNDFKTWKLTLFFATIISLSMVQWTMVTTFEAIALFLGTVFTFHNIEKERYKLLSSGKAHDVFLNKSGLRNLPFNNKFYSYNSGYGGLLAYSRSCSDEKDIPVPKNFTYNTKTRQIDFYFELKVIESERFSKIENLTVKQYLDKLHVFNGLQISNENEKLKEVSAINYGSEMFLSKGKSVVTLNLMNKRENEKLLKKWGTEYIVKVLSIIFLSMLLVATLIPVNSLIVLFVIPLIAGQLIKEKVMELVNVQIVEKKEEFYKGKIKEQLIKFKAGLSSNYECHKIKNKNLLLRRENKTFSSSLLYKGEQLETGIENVKVVSNGEKMLFTIKINGKPADPEYLKLLEDIGFEIFDAFTEEAIDLHDLNFAY